MGLRAVVMLPPNLKGYLEKLGGILDAFGELWNSRASPRIPQLEAVGVSIIPYANLLSGANTLFTAILNVLTFCIPDLNDITSQPL
jgi:hypothetical protein